MKSEKQRLKKSPEAIERQIENIVNAVAAAASNPAFLEKLSTLEQQKLDLSQKLIEVKEIKEKTVITEETLRQLLSQFGTHIANRASRDQEVHRRLCGKGDCLRKACRSQL
ncbi:hypothetical protein YDYSG_53520 [Paenibacillus tyrfis]|uniref:hypothetical protein n=1 Tax=Paenibacillus tyrfis TaxID=1501230 RepID=UPI002491D5D9|nr:hypothetical protein [Paenibacillus tyrfis]GLI09320.1 hypothetical protein YDYSG_53520 [Paenibacillus tyrfis]